MVDYSYTLENLLKKLMEDRDINSVEELRDAAEYAGYLSAAVKDGYTEEEIENILLDCFI